MRVGRPVDQHAPAARLDLVLQRREQVLPRAPRVAEVLLARVLPTPQPQLVPDPHHRDVVRAGAELAAQHRAPHLAPGGAPHPLLDPLARGDPLVRRLVVGEPLQPEHGEAHPDAVERRHRAEAQEVHRRRERPLAAVGEHRDARRPPLELVRHPELLVEPRDVAVGGEQVVVVALEPVPAADVDRRRLAAEPGPALVDVDLVARRRDPVRGDQAAHARPDDGDLHFSRFARSRTT